MEEIMLIQYNPTDALVQPILEQIKRIKSFKILSKAKEYVPNAETLAAIEEARNENLKTYSDVKELMNDLLKDE